MIFSIITIFPELFESFQKCGVISRAFKEKICQLDCYNPRDFTTDAYRRIDDKAYGGGPGMVMKVEPLELSLHAAYRGQLNAGVSNPLRVYLSPQGKLVNQNLVNDLIKNDGMILVCGRYEGVDERFIERNIDLELCLGDFVVSGGELPAMMLIDAMVRLFPSVLNDSNSALQDSFMNGLLDYPHYTTPRDYNGSKVPDVLLSGNHEAIKKWRLQQSLLRTFKRRPDLLNNRELNNEESRLLECLSK